MRVLLLSNMFPSAADPLFGIFVKNFKSELEKQGVAFPHPVLIHGKVRSSLKKAVRYLRHYCISIFRFVTLQYDLVYVHYLSHHIPILLLMAWLKGKSVVVNVHGSDIIELQKHKVLNNLAGFVLKRIGLLVVPTSYFRDLVMEKYPFLKPENIFISPSGGIDGSKFYPKKPAESKQVLTLGFISRFIEEKGWKVFMQALVLLKKQGIPFKALIAGKGPDEGAIIEYIRANGLQSDVAMLGLIKQEELLEVYNKLNLYIFPTYREAESLGLTGLEAMSCGTPVVASNISGPATYIESGVNGFLFEPRNSKALSDIIVHYLGMDPESQKKISEQAIATGQRYEKGLVAKKLINRLESLCI